MAPRNKHWPSLFKKSSYSSNNQTRRINSLLTGLDDEERTPQPRPRWNPKPEQIRILEDLFNSGTVSPSREEITKIRKQLQEFGDVGDASVFYWFQNRKSRSKRKRIPYNEKPQTQQNSTTPCNSLPETITPPPNSSSASSSDHQKVSPNPNEITISENIGSSNINDEIVVLPDSPAVSLNQNQADEYFHTPAETDLLLPTPPIFSFPMENHINEGVVSNAMTTPQDFDDLSDFADIIQPFLNHESIKNYGNENGIFDSMDGQYNQENIQEETMNMMHLHQQDPQLSFGVTAASSNDDHSTDLAPFPPIEIYEPVDDVPFLIADQPQGFGEEDGTGKCRVITNDDVFEVNAGLFNVREFFGDGAFLVDNSSGIPVLTDEWGVTLLHHGANYYLMYY